MSLVTRAKDGTAMPVASVAHTSTSLPMSAASTDQSFGLDRVPGLRFQWFSANLAFDLGFKLEF